MRNLTRLFIASSLAALSAAALTTIPVRAAVVKVMDPPKGVINVDRDSNGNAVNENKTNKIIGRTFLGNNVNPHMVMMSPDGRYVVTGGTRANKAYIVDVRTLKLVKVINVD